MQRSQPRSRIIALLVICATIAPAAVQADTVQLSNGDSLTGQVVSLDDQKLKLHSEVIGDITISRDKIAAIYLGDTRPAIASKQNTLPAPNVDVVPALPLGDNPSPEDILQQIQAGGGINPASIKDITKAFPLLAQPEVQSYFNETVGGLVSGKLDVQDIRSQAVDALDQLRDLENDLGPGAAQALSPYKNILEKFVRETAPAEQTDAPLADPKK